MTNHNKLFSFFLIIWITSNLSNGQTSFKVRAYDPSNGLSQSVVNSVMQDSRGFLWAGTQDGLNLFDGYSFKIFRHDTTDTTSIATNYIWKVYEDSKGRIWVGTYGGGLERFNREEGNFIHHKHTDDNINSLNGNDVRSIYQDEDGILWIGTNKGLNSYDPKNNLWQNYSEDEGGTVPYKNIRDIYPHSQNELWLLSYESGLIFFDKQTGKSKLYENDPRDKNSISNNQVWRIIKDKQGIYWVPTFGGGVNIFDSKKYTPFGEIKFTRPFKNELDKNITAVYETADGKILLGPETQGLAIIDETRRQLDFIPLAQNNSNGLTSDIVWDICANNSGGYWLGTYGGGLNFIIFNQSKFKHITSAQLSNPIVFAIKKIKEKYFVGTYGGGMDILNAKGKPEITLTESNSGIASNYITTIEIEDSNTIWIGTDENGVSRYNISTGKFTNFNPTNSELSNVFIKDILIDSYKNVWVGTLKEMVNLQRPDKVNAEFYSDQIFKNNIRAIIELKPGKILIGTHGDGIFLHDIKKGSFTKLKGDVIKAIQVRTLFIDSSNNLWIGTRSNGVIKYNFETSASEFYTEKNGLCNNSILGIEQDASRFLWLITNDGISRFDPEAEKFFNYFVVDGLQSNEFVQGAIYKDDTGLIYAGNTKGIEIIDPVKFILSNFNPSLDFTGLKIMNEEYPLSKIADSELNLSYKNNFIRIDFTSLDFTNPAKNRYRYKLTPGNGEWINLGTEHSVNFANLTPDEYLLELQGSNSDGVWSSDIKRLAIIIEPPFYSTVWFYALVIFIIGTILYAFHSVSLRKKIEIERLRLKIASDLHDEVGSSLSQISINADMINYEGDINKIRKKGDFIRSKSGEIMNVMNDVIWSIDSRNDKLENLVEKIKLTTNQLAGSKEMKTNFDIKIQNASRKLNVEFRQNIYLVIKEAVNNAVKYSGGDLIEIKIEEKRDTFLATIADNGSGLPQEPKKTGNGLINMKQRIEALGGKIEFKNNNGLTINLEAKII